MIRMSKEILFVKFLPLFPLFYDRVTVFSIKIRGAGSMCDFTIIIVINENGSIIPVSNFIKLFKQNVYIIFQKLK